MKLLSRPQTALLLSLIALLATAATTSAADAPLGSPTFAASPERPVGWRGDGSGHFPAATPPTAWSRVQSGQGYETKGILWMTPLPAGGISSPIVVGDRIFITTEPTDLVCADKATGKILWIRSHPECDSLTDEERQIDGAFTSDLPRLTAQLERVNAALVQELNAQLPTAATSAFRSPPSLKQKQALEHTIQDVLNGLDKKRFDHSWPQGVYGYSTETPASDGTHICAYFATGVSVCYDQNGKRQWINHGASGGEEKGNYTSPLLLGGQFIVWGGPDMRAYDVQTGQKLWTNTVKGANASSLYSFRSGRDLVAAYRNFYVRIRDGKALWGSGNIDNSTQTPIVSGELICTWVGGDKGAMKLLRIPEDTETGKLTAMVICKPDVWAPDELPKTKEQPFDRGVQASPLLVDGLIYRISSGGGLLVNDAATGELLYRKILPMKPRTAYWAWGGACSSPSFAGGHIYLMDNQGTTVILQPGREYKQVAVNRLEDSRDGKEQVQNLANPFFEGSRIYYRTPDYLLCIGEK